MLLVTVDELMVKDDLLGTSVTEDVIQEAQDYLFQVASEMNIDVALVQPTYTVKRFITMYVFKELCMRKSYVGTRNTTYGKSSSDDADSYALKYEFYKNELTTLERGLTESALTGTTSHSGAGGYRTISIHRG